MAVASHSSRSETKSSLSYSSAFANFASPILMPATISSVRLRDRCSLPPSPPPSSSAVRFSMERRPPSPRTVTKRSNNAVPKAVASHSSRSKTKSWLSYLLAFANFASPVLMPATISSARLRDRRSLPKRCMCSPTSHPGSFRCAHHKRKAVQKEQQQQRQKTASLSSTSLKQLRRSALKNSLARIGCVEVDRVKRTLPIPVRSSSHQIRRRDAFQPRPSRLSVMSKAQ